MKCERKNVSEPADWWAAWERAAAAKGLHLSEWIGQQCNRALPREVRDELSHRAKRGRIAAAEPED